MKVFLTVDTEVWPVSSGWPHTPLPASFDATRYVDAYFRGGPRADARGLPFQLRVLAERGLKATYFVDPLFSFALGLQPLRDVVALLRESGQEIGLHLHPEWLTDPRCHGLPAFAGPLLHAYGGTGQERLIEAGLHQLAEAGSPPVCAFRAGSWGANRTTLAALVRNRIRFDSSLNALFRASFPDLDAAERRRHTQPFQLDGVWEFPVTHFIDRPPAGRRPLHVCAASFDEMRAVLEQALEHGWYAVVLVLHSFEFVRVARLAEGREVRPQRLLARRYERLCTYLADRPHEFETCHFGGIDTAAIPQRMPPEAPVSTRARTALRHVEQLASRVY